MSSTMTVACPKCRKQLRVPTEMAGKKVRCRGCEAVFAIKPSAAKAAAKATPVDNPPPAPHVDDEDAQSEFSYGLTATDLTPRCPNCAGALEDEDQVICLGCGYNLRKRVQLESKTVYEVQTADRFQWLLPGIGALIGGLSLIGLLIFCYVNMRGWMEGSFAELEEGKFIIKPNGVTFFMALALAAPILKLLKFAYSRLVVNNKPPEIEKKK